MNANIGTVNILTHASYSEQIVIADSGPSLFCEFLIFNGAL